MADCSAETYLLGPAVLDLRLGGYKFRRMCLRLDFGYFDGHKPITSLPFCPFCLNDQRNVIRDTQIKQGVEYRRVCRAAQESRMFESKGEAILVKKGSSGVQRDDDRVSIAVITRRSAGASNLGR